MRDRKKKYLLARPKAEFSLQFWRDKQGTPNFTITSNPTEEGKDFCTGIDEYIFARNLIESGQFSDTELNFLVRFFNKVKKEKEEREAKKKLRRVEIYCNGMVCCFDGAGAQMPRLQGEWNKCKDQILKEDAELVEYRFGTFRGVNTLIDSQTARRLSIEVCP